MKELISIGGYAQPKEMHIELTKELSSFGYKVTSYTLAEFYKLDNKDEVLEGKVVMTHSIGLETLPFNAKFGRLLAFSPPEATPLLKIFYRVSFASKFSQQHGRITHTKEILRHPLVHAKFWLKMPKLSATSRLIELKQTNKKSSVELYYTASDKISRSSDYDFSLLEKNGIMFKDVGGRHRDLHETPGKILKKVNL